MGDKGAGGANERMGKGRITPKKHGLNKRQNFILSLASLSFIRRGIEGEVSQGHKLYVI
jgi:hypothetical protein